MKTQFSRRQFLRTHLPAALAASAVPTLLPATVFGRAGRTAPNSRVVVGCIGVGPQGRGDLRNFLQQADCRVVALCDVAKRNLNAALQMVNGHYQDKHCATYHDFRELIARKDIDALLIATPDHWHVPVALAAARARKDMYLEKPMGLSVREDQILRRACRRNGVIFQFGTQQRSGEQFRQACEIVRNGRIGHLRHINVWCDASRPGGSVEPIQPPADLDYEFWLGPAPQKPYTAGKAFDSEPPATWKTWWYNYDYALGFVAGWGVHPLDIAYWGHPAMRQGISEVSGQAVFPMEGACNTAVAWEVQFRFADGVGLTYKGVPNGYDHVTPMNDVSAWRKKYGRAIDHGTAFEGTEGWVLVDRGAIRTSPESLLEYKPGPNEVQLIRSSSHARNFIEAVRNRRPAICPIGDAVQADILCHLSDIAMRLKRPLKWDPARERFVGDDDANRRLRLRPMRAPWKIS